MTFLNPLALWFLAFIPVILLFYILKLKRKEKIVSSTLLWEQVLKDMTANTPFQKLRQNLLLLLQILLVILLSLALARPSFTAKSETGRDFILVLDGSASMKAVDVKPNRFAQAKKSALKVIEQMTKADRMMIIQAGRRLEIISTFSQDKDALSKAVKGMETKDTPANLKEALVLAFSILQNLRKGEIFLFTDGAGNDLKDLQIDTKKINFIAVGQGNNNVGITALDIRKATSGTYDYQVFTAVTNFSPQQKDFYLQLSLNKKMTDSIKLSIPPHSQKSHIFVPSNFREGIIEVAVDLDDDLAVDNVARAILKKEKERNILLVTSGNQFLEKALTLLPFTSVFRIKPSDYTKSDNYQLTIFDNCSPKKLEAGNYLFINAVPPAGMLKTVGEIDYPLVIDWDRTHPALKFVNFSSVQIGKALKIEKPTEGKVLVEGENYPLMVELAKNNYKVIVVGFDIFASDWPLQTSFPIFIANTVDWLTHQADYHFQRIKTGETIEITPPKDKNEITVVFPNERKITIPSKGQNILFNETDFVGTYTIIKGAEKEQFAVNLLDEQESDITPKTVIKTGKDDIVKSAPSVLINKEYWQYFIFIVLAVLLLEWYVYHRRLV